MITISLGAGCFTKWILSNQMLTQVNTGLWTHLYAGNHWVEEY